MHYLSLFIIIYYMKYSIDNVSCFFLNLNFLWFYLGSVPILRLRLHIFICIVGVVQTNFHPRLVIHPHLIITSLNSDLWLSCILWLRLIILDKSRSGCFILAAEIWLVSFQPLNLPLRRHRLALEWILFTASGGVIYSLIREIPSYVFSNGRVNRRRGCNRHRWIIVSFRPSRIYLSKIILHPVVRSFALISKLLIDVFLSELVFFEVVIALASIEQSPSDPMRWC